MKSILKYKCILICLYSLCTVVSCQTMSLTDRSSGAPHVRIENTSSSVVMNTIVSSMKNSGFRVISSNNSTVVVGRASGPELAAEVFGASFSGNAEIRIAYAVSSAGSTVEVSADISLVANASTSSERSASLNESKYAQSMQASLDTLKGAVRPTGRAAAQPQASPDATRQPALQSPSLADSQLTAYMDDIRSRGSVPAKVRAAADLYNAGKITKEQRNVFQEAILKGEL